MMWNLITPNVILFLFIYATAPAGTGVLMNKNKHLTLNDRYDIMRALNEGKSFKAIGRLIGKDCTTVSKEIKGHIIFEKKGAPYRPFNDCLHRKKCKLNHQLCVGCTFGRGCSNCGKCTSICELYEKELCPLLSKPPYVCNGCPVKSKCTLEKHMYDPHKAHQEYLDVLSESRSGFNLTEEELKEMNSIISPLLKNGQSLHHIMTNNADAIRCCEKTAYVYINNNLFDARNIDMPRVVKFRPRRKKSVELKVDKKCRIGRSYDEYKSFMAANPSLPVVELDSVEGIKGGAVLLTIHFVRQKLQLAFYRESNSSQSVTDIFRHLYSVLGAEIYKKLFPVLLADNGTEFSNPTALEFNEQGNRLSHVFYCNPSAPNEKGSCEVNHEFIRRVIPKGTDIGKYTPSQINLMMNHINSYSRPELGEKTPYAMFEFYYGKEILDLLQVKLIPPNEIILKPSVLH